MGFQRRPAAAHLARENPVVHFARATEAVMASEAIQVVVRVRPPNNKEKSEGTLPIVTTSTERQEVCLIRGTGHRAQRNIFKFQNVFGSFSTQQVRAAHDRT